MGGFLATPVRVLAVSVALAGHALLAGAGHAGQLPAPSGEVVLTVTGEVPTANRGAVAEFDLDMLRGLGMTTIRTTTIWTEGVQEFSGPPLAALMEALGVEGGVLLATAINDYQIDIPVSDAAPDGPILAISLNGAPMTVRDKGPVWIVYPYDRDAAYRTETTYSRSIWQLVRLEVRR